MVFLMTSMIRSLIYVYSGNRSGLIYLLALFIQMNITTIYIEFDLLAVKIGGGLEKDY